MSHAVGLQLKILMISGSIMNSASRSGQAYRPLSVIRPNVSSRRHRSLLSSVQHPVFFLGLKRCSEVPSIFLTVESIQPKHNASSTASRYHSAFLGGVLPRLTAIQHSFFCRMVFAEPRPEVEAVVNSQNICRVHLIWYAG